MKRNFLAYDGQEFTVEWYFDSKGRSSAFEYFEDLPADRKKKALHLFALIANIGKLFNEEKFRYEGDQIFVVKPAPDRFLCFFFEGSKIIITNAYEKKSQKMPVKEKDKALKAKNDYFKRSKAGTYYE